MIQVTNAQFLAALFGDDASWVHVTDFTYDPNHIPKDRHLAAWAGDYFSRYKFSAVSNQYFTVSNFYADNLGKARRRKVLYRHTPVIVLDDVKEKLSMSEVSKLPAPSWILETSPGSEQWGYILDKPCTNRAQVENLLDGLVANGLAPEGRDPGMKGVTRYVRLPDGYNNKASKLVNGQPFKCRLTLWQPFNRVTIEQLAAPFMVDLNAARRESRVDGASAIDDHPLLKIPDLVHIKEVRSDGRFDITCPWADEHTDADDSGAAIFTNTDGTIGFKCHHGACQNRTGRHLLQFIENQAPGFGSQFTNWKIMRAFAPVATVSFMDVPAQNVVSFLESVKSTTVTAPIVAETPIKQASISFMTPLPAVTAVSFMTPVPVSQPPQAPPMQQAAIEPDGLQLMVDSLRRERPTSTEARVIASTLLKHVDELSKIDQNHWHNQVCDLMAWSKSDFKDILRDLRQQWYGEKVSKADFYDRVIFVKELNQFYDLHAAMFLSTEAFQNSFCHEDAEAKKIALQDGRVKKVDRLDYAPKMPRIFLQNGITYGNTYTEDTTAIGEPGDCTKWLEHFDHLGWAASRKHVLQFMAFTLLHPEYKINHMLLFGSAEGCGKDFILYPLLKAMGRNGNVISGEELLSDQNDYLLSTKYLHINETELADRREAQAISNKLKPLAAAPPDTLRINQKFVKQINVRNIINSTMTTNSQLPFRLNGTSRRFFGLWSDLNVRDHRREMLPEWRVYWNDRWSWMKNGGYNQCIHYLRHHVDLSDFNPGEAPPMTDFLREIAEASRSPAALTIEAFIMKRIDNFQCDLLKAEDAAETLRVGPLLPSIASDILVDVKTFTKPRVGQFLSELEYCTKINILTEGAMNKIWCVRNYQKYARMSPFEVQQEYERQVKAIRGATVLTVVK